MLTKENLTQFRKEGYTLVPQVLSSSQVAELRAVLRPLFNTPEAIENSEGGRILVDIFNRHPETSWLPFHPPIVEALKSILGNDFVMLREVGAHLNLYAPAHKDTTSQEKDGHTFHKQDDFLMVEAALYLQDNDPQMGGGLDVEPCSHKRADPLITGGRESFNDKLKRRFSGNPRAEYVTIPSRAGDLVLFDFRINHKASPARVSPIVEKIAVFIACSRNNRHVKSYHRFIESRTDAAYTYLRDFHHSSHMIQRAEQAGVILA